MARVTWCRRFAGGIASSVHQLRIENGGEAAHRLVLKRWLRKDRVEGRAEQHREAAALAALATSDLPAPRLVATSNGPETDGHPALLMTRLPGRVNLVPRHQWRWLQEMAVGLGRIHAFSADVDPTPAWPRPGDHRVPIWSRRPDLWRAAAELLDCPPPPGSNFIHGDYQHFNLLWAGERLTGVVDWTAAGLGHPDRDVGHCRLNLAVLFSPDWAHRFRLAYQAETGRRIDPWWDVHEICMYSRAWPRFIPVQVAGRAPLDVKGMNRRVEQLLADSLP